MAEAYAWLEELRLKRMVFIDEILELLTHSFPNLKVLVLTSCDDFSTDSPATIVAHCRHWHCLAFVPYLFASFQRFRTMEA
jgi:transport inhibitor response 1